MTMSIKNIALSLNEMRRHGFEWDHVQRPLMKVSEELEEVKEAMQNKDHDHLKEELGDLILASINLARYLDVDPEHALETAYQKLVKRYDCCMEIAQDKKLDFTKLSFADRLKIWKQAKTYTDDNSNS